jgi:short-subunit dehydrogenase
VTTVLPSAVRTRLASGVPLGRGLPTVEPEAVARAIVGSVASRRAEVTVPRYLAGWDLLSAATPGALLSVARRVIRDRRALTSIEHDVRGDYEKSIEEQARGRR